MAELLRGMFAVPRPLLAGAELAGPSTAVLPVLFHLLWCQQLRTEMAAPLTETSLVWAVS